MNLAKNIKHFRKKNRLTQNELADLINVNRTTISKWELDKSQPSLELIKAMAKLFNISVSVLTGEDTIIDNLEKAKRSVRTTNVIPNKNRILFMVPLINVVLSLLLVSSLLVVLVHAYIGYNDQENQTKLVYSNIESVSLCIYVSNKDTIDLKMNKSITENCYYLNNIDICMYEHYFIETKFKLYISIIAHFMSGYTSDLSRNNQLTAINNGVLEHEALMPYPYFKLFNTYDFRFYIENEMGYLEVSLS